MLGQITSQQLAEWEAFWKLNHLGDDPAWRDDVRMAVMASHIVNVFAKNAVRPDRLMPTFSDPVEQELATDQDGMPIDPAAAFRARMLAYAARSKGRSKKDRNGVSPRETPR